MASAVYRSKSVLIESVREISADIQKKVTCSHSIINEVEFVKERRSLEACHKQFGESYLRLLSYHIRLEDARKACISAGASIGAGGTPIRLAITRFKVGDCSEMSTLAIMEIMKKRLPGISVLCCAPGNIDVSHCFVALGADKGIFTVDQDPLKAINQSNKRVIILDPLFNLVRRTKDIKGTDLETYLRIRNITVIQAAEDIPHPSEEIIDGLEKQADEIHQRAVILLSNPGWTSSPNAETMANFLLLQRIAQIEQMTPEVQWKKAKTGAIWIRGTQEQAQSICDKLNAHFKTNLIPQKEKESDNYVVTLSKKALLTIAAPMESDGTEKKADT